MPIPDYQTLMLPLLRLAAKASNGSVRAATSEQPAALNGAAISEHEAARQLARRDGTQPRLKAEPRRRLPTADRS